MSGSQDPRSPAPLGPRPLRRRRRPRAAIAAVALLAGALAVTGCGGSGGGTTSTGGGAPKALSVTLDFQPNAVHAGLYVAQADGLYRREGLRVALRAPGSGADGAKLLAAGRTDVAIMDIHDVALAREKGADLVAVGALVQRPLASLVAGKDVARPRDLAGQRVGVSGLASDDAVVDQIVRGDGGDPGRVRRVTIGFDAVPAVASGRVAAATGFWNAEGVALTKRRPGSRVFRLDRFGAPAYPELLVMTTRRRLHADPAAVRRFVAAAAAGYRRVLGSDSTPPMSSSDVVADLRRGAGAATIDPSSTAAQLRTVTPAFRDATGGALGIDRPTMRRWSAWEAKVGITKRAPDVGALVWTGAPGA